MDRLGCTHVSAAVVYAPGRRTHRRDRTRQGAARRGDTNGHPHGHGVARARSRPGGSRGDVLEARPSWGGAQFARSSRRPLCRCGQPQSHGGSWRQAGAAKPERRSPVRKSSVNSSFVLSKKVGCPRRSTEER
jgi:hypothetical protein